jgi:hypothetical protein
MILENKGFNSKKMKGGLRSGVIYMIFIIEINFQLYLQILLVVDWLCKLEQASRRRASALLDDLK